jgi:hypothetical protein
MDMKWMQSLWLGALSLGNRPEITYLMYEELSAELQAHVPSGGFFLHSDIVWAYPELIIEAKQISDTADGSDDGTLDIGQLRVTWSDNYTDYIERKVSSGRQQVQPKGLMEQREIAPDCQLVLITDYVIGQCVKHNNKYYECIQTHRAGSRFDGNTWEVCQTWAANQRYILGNFVTYGGQSYRCIENHVSSSVFTEAMWEVSDTYWQAQTNYQINQCVRYSNEYYVCVETHTSGYAFGFNRWRPCATWSEQIDYAKTEFVTYESEAYRCIQNHTSSNSFEPDKWQIIDSIDWKDLDHKAFNYIALSLPPEALHYGADVTVTVVDGDTQYQYDKDIKYLGRTVCTLTELPVDEKGIVNVGELVTAILQGLQDSHLVDDTYKANLTDFGSARLSRYMLEGEPKVEFSLGGTI